MTLIIEDHIHKQLWCPLSGQTFSLLGACSLMITGGLLSLINKHPACDEWVWPFDNQQNIDCQESFPHVQVVMFQPRTHSV